uniref:Phomoidride biosynthesis cluster protein B n=1 Tax=Fungal sp. (strain ATCC 74256) TaxID=1729595 RepID=PHIB_FUNX7|nr:RecName: Full=Phomoidride biosynthesis cluster protein B [fungal sp. ATCC 74256]BBG28499.1 putative hypothetical protein [fungal sp. ATCC 74256]
MSAILKLLEYCLGRLFYRRRGYDAQLFYKSAAFAKHSSPTIPITSPDCGKTGAILTTEYSKFGSGKIPQFTWPAAAPDVKEFLMLCEDPDAPMGHPNVHGIYCFIPPTVTSFGPTDLELIKEVDGVKVLESGYRVGKNRRNVVYIAPRPPLGHGPHRYLFELVALSEKLDPEGISKVPDKGEIEKAIEGKVASWGLWEATYESTWDRK